MIGPFQDCNSVYTLHQLMSILKVKVNIHVCHKDTQKYLYTVVDLTELLNLGVLLSDERYYILYVSLPPSRVQGAVETMVDIVKAKESDLVRTL